MSPRDGKIGIGTSLQSTTCNDLPLRPPGVLIRDGGGGRLEHLVQATGEYRAHLWVTELSMIVLLFFRILFFKCCICCILSEFLSCAPISSAQTTNATRIVNPGEQTNRTRSPHYHRILRCRILYRICIAPSQPPETNKPQG